MSVVYKPVLKVFVFFSAMLAVLGLIFGPNYVSYIPKIYAGYYEAQFVIAIVLITISYILHEDFKDYIAIPLLILGGWMLLYSTYYFAALVTGL